MANNKKEDIGNSLQGAFQEFVGTSNHASKFSTKDIKENKTMAILSYIIPPVPFFLEKNSKFVKFHSNQGMNMFIWYVLLYAFAWIVDIAFPWDFITIPIYILLTLSLIFLMGFGIINTVNEKAMDLPGLSKLNIINMINYIFGND